MEFCSADSRRIRDRGERQRMSKQQEIIKNIMHALDTNEGGSSGLDKAIRENTSFSGTQDAINHFLAARDRYSSADAFLREACGIVLDNEDTGALTGSDAGSGTVKTASSVVPNYGATRDGESNVYNVNGTKFTFYGQKFPDIFYYYRTGNQKMQERQLSWRQYAEGSGFYKTASKMSYDLVHYIMAPALSLVEETYGLSLTENGSKTNTIYIGFSNVGSDFSTQNTLAQTGLRYYYRYNSTSRQPTTLIRLVYDVNAFYDPDKDIDYLRYSQGSQDGRRSKYSTMYLDRVTAHELTHAVMQANIDNFNDLPLWFVEGSAELTQGADDTRTRDIRAAAASSTSLSHAIREASGTTSSAGSEPDSAYYAGYMLLRYIAQQGAGSSQAQEKPQGSGSDLPAGLSYTDSGRTVHVSDGYSGTVYLNPASGISYRRQAQTIDATAAGGTLVLAGWGDQSTRIRGGRGKNILWGGGAASDTLIGGSGANEYWFSNVDGNDTVENYQDGRDKLRLWSGPLSDIATRGDDLLLSSGRATLTVRNMADKAFTLSVGGKDLRIVAAHADRHDTIRYEKDIQFYFGSAAHGATLAVTGGSGARISLAGCYGPLYGGVNRIDASRSTGRDILCGGSGSTIIGGSGETDMWGGSAASDTLIGGGGRTTYWYGKGDGRDTIENAKDEDILYLYNDIPTTMFDCRSGDLVISTANPGDTLTIKDWRAHGPRTLRDHYQHDWTITPTQGGGVLAQPR